MGLVYERTVFFCSSDARAAGQLSAQAQNMLMKRSAIPSGH